MDEVDGNQPTGSYCPAWCSGEHDELLPESERCHVSQMRRFSVLALSRVPSGAGYKLARAHEQREIEVQRFSFLDDAHEWIYVGDGHHYFELSAADARLLARELARVVEGGGASGE